MEHIALTRFNWDPQNRRLWQKANVFSPNELLEMCYGMKIVGYVYTIYFQYMALSYDPISQDKAYVWRACPETSPMRKRDIKVYLHQ